MISDDQNSGSLNEALADSHRSMPSAVTSITVIDAVSLPFLENAVIDFTEELIGARFVIENPNATSSCGCGTSFSM